MATIKVRIYVAELSNVMVDYTHLKVYRSETQTGTYVEITNPGTIILLVVDQTIYEYIDTTAPTSSYWYKVTFYNNSTFIETDLTDSFPMQGTDTGLYCTIQSIRDEGVTVAELSDERALGLIIHWQSWIDKMTGQFFTPKELTLDFDGDGSKLLQLPVPIIECAALYTNDDFTNELSSDKYTVYNRKGPVQDDRRNPKIKLKRTNISDIYTFNRNTGFAIGDLNQRVVGTWGYVEADGSIPISISRAVRILVVGTKEFLNDDDIDQLRFGRVIEEVTDRHRIEYSDLYNRLKSWAPTGITEVDNTLRSYRAPGRVTAPRNMNCV